MRNTFVQSLQILLASGVVNRDISALQFGEIPFSGSDADDDCKTSPNTSWAIR